MTDRDKLAGIIRNARMFADPLAQVGYAEADALLANGIIVPPCKVGDTVYKINGNHIEKFKVARFVISSHGIRAEDLYGVQVV